MVGWDQSAILEEVEEGRWRVCGREIGAGGGDMSVWVWSRRGQSACSSCVGPRDSTQEASEWKTLPRQEEMNLIAYSSHLNIICITLHVMYM